MIQLTTFIANIKDYYYVDKNGKFYTSSRGSLKEMRTRKGKEE